MVRSAIITNSYDDDNDDDNGDDNADDICGLIPASMNTPGIPVSQLKYRQQWDSRLQGAIMPIVISIRTPGCYYWESFWGWPVLLSIFTSLGFSHNKSRNRVKRT
jgi:hypothetical protein